ncbi:hypothetical protein RCC89_09310 [Cytophagaceae bacterium ABcell3]|nr:hypothetical protein RCC89_09310 [Cytophagaceae bacterium ABcell3]
MKKKSLLFILTILLLQGTMGFAQKIKHTSGDLKSIKGISKLNIVYDYSSMSVGKFDKEEDYVSEKVEKYNKKEPGKGDKWKENWVADRENRYQPKFETLINKSLRKQNVVVGNFEDAEYTMILKTTHTELGWNVGVSRVPAHTNMEAIFVKTGTTEPVLTITIKKSPGRDAAGFDFDSGVRVQESYAKAGKSLGKFLAKKSLK